MKKYVFVCLFALMTYVGMAQNVEGSWILFADNGMSELSINLTGKVIGLERYDEEQRPSGMRNDLEIVEVVKKKNYTVYVGQVPDREKYISLCFFETKEKGNIKLFIKERFNSIAEAKSFEKISDLGVWLYSKERVKEIQALKSIEKLTKNDAMKALNTLLDFTKKEAKKHEDLNNDAGIYFASALQHNLIKLGYNSLKNTGKVEDMFRNFPEDKDIQKILDEVESLASRGERKVEEKYEETEEMPVEEKED